MSTRDVTENWPAISDDEVMAAVKTGSANAFAVLYDRYYTPAYRIAWSVCRDNGRAEEAVQEAFAAVWTTRGSYESQVGRVAPWVLTIARYRAIDIARRNGHDCAHQTTDDRLDGLRERSDVPSLAAAHAQTHHILSLLAQLPDTQREVITLAFYGQQTHTEIAAYLELPEGTVKGRVRLGLERLRSGIER
ncbi:MAG: sigma-70 family RNA polymerase sigma factor [Chloroflexota bacterium]|nr:sigma-70 family RNA polymerase sigma factor [Chloroflexota bacterium]